MSKQNIIRAWKDENYRRSLSEAERAALPENPAGRVDLDELTAAELAGIDGRLSSSRPGACTRVFEACLHEVTPPRGGVATPRPDPERRRLVRRRLGAPRGDGRGRLGTARGE